MFILMKLSFFNLLSEFTFFSFGLKLLFFLRKVRKLIWKFICSSIHQTTARKKNIKISFTYARVYFCIAEQLVKVQKEFIALLFEREQHFFSAHFYEWIITVGSIDKEYWECISVFRMNSYEFQTDENVREMKVSVY